MSQVHHTGGQCLTQRGLIGIGTVSALMQSRAAGIQQNHDLILHDGELDLYGGTALFKPFNLITLAETRYDRFFNNTLTIGYTMQYGIERPAFNGERVRLAQPLLPFDRAYSLKQLLKGSRRKGRKQKQNPLAHPAADVGTGNLFKIAVKEYPAVFG